MNQPETSTSVAATSATEKPKPTLGQEISLFIKHIDAVGGDMFVGMFLAIDELSKQTRASLHKFEDQNCEVVRQENKRTVTIQNTHIREWRRLMRLYEHSELSRSLLPRSLLVTLISQYDAYIGRLLRIIFVRKPEILNSSDRKISFENLTLFNSLDAAREHILEKEVESILRSSHTDQLKWMERTFDLTLTKGLNCGLLSLN